MSSGIMYGMRWGGRLGALPGWNAMSPCGSTLRGGTGDTSDVVSWVFTLGGGVTCGGAVLMKISAIFRSYDVSFSLTLLVG